MSPDSLATTGIAPEITPLGDAAITLSFGTTVSRALSERAHAAARAITQANIPGVMDIVPAHASVTLFFDPLRTTGAELAAALRALAATPASPSSAVASDAAREVIVIPVRYNGADLADVARTTGLAPEEVVARHAGRVYHVYMVGFVPGFAYLGDIDDAIVLPRRATPRATVAAGSVAIAGIQTAVYPLATPGGWHIIGHTDARMFDPDREPPSLLAAGDRVRFEPIP